MEILTESIFTENDYETERGKPMPSTIHAFVQSNLLVELTNRYGKQFTILPELSLDAGTPKPTVPDITIYPKFKINVFEQDVIKRKDTPLCTIEILSPRQSHDELVEKAENFLRTGVQSAWVVVPKMAAISVYYAPGVFKLFSGDDVLVDEKLGVELPLERVFE